MHIQQQTSLVCVEIVAECGVVAAGGVKVAAGMVRLYCLPPPIGHLRNRCGGKPETGSSEVSRPQSGRHAFLGDNSQRECCKPGADWSQHDAM